MQLFHEHEQVVVCHEPEAGLRAIIAVHDTTLGPSLGGIRMWSYPTDEAALTDVLRLARGMTYKNAVAGLDLGGGKTVVLGDPRTDKTHLLFRALGRSSTRSAAATWRPRTSARAPPTPRSSRSRPITSPACRSSGAGRATRRR